MVLNEANTSLFGDIKIIMNFSIFVPYISLHLLVPYLLLRKEWVIEVVFYVMWVKKGGKEYLDENYKFSNKAEWFINWENE
jgi:hypothetical protein